MARRLSVHGDLRLPGRQCLFCLGGDNAFGSEEHVIPRALGDHRDFVLPAGVVCDTCNSFLGRQVDAPFLNRFDVRLMRGIEGLQGRRGHRPMIIEGRGATARLEVQLRGGGPSVRIMARRADETPDGGLDIEIDPVLKDPQDIVARTLRELWKMTLGCLFLRLGRQTAIAPEWDHLRRAVLGAPFSGFLLQRPFELRSTREVRIELDLDIEPRRIRFAMGGVALAAPLDADAPVKIAPARRAGWDVLETSDPPPAMVRLRLDPDA